MDTPRNMSRDMNTFTSFDGTRIAFHDEGDGPAVVLAHGFGTDGLTQFGPFERSRAVLERVHAGFREVLGKAPPMLEPTDDGRAGLVAQLRATGARVIVPDMRGFGESDKPQIAAAYSDSAMARDIVSLVQHLRLPAFDVLGFSVGAVTVARLLALGETGVRSAVMSGVGDYILEGEIMNLPKNFPIPEDLPKPLTMRAHATALMRRRSRLCWTAARSYPVT
jgi:pimeloyl-ACP methyl ester carboxylesterase